VTTTKKTVKEYDYRALAEFRYHIRRYLDFSDRAARAVGMEPRQYQLLLAIKGLPEDGEPTVGALAEQLRLRHHSTVELINRAERKQLVERSRIGTRVLVHLTSKGRRVLERAVEERLQELRTAGPVLIKALQGLMNSRGSRKNKRKHSPNQNVHGKSGNR
jgi:DNA-binding MarR family transcriptional regulator